MGNRSTVVVLALVGLCLRSVLISAKPDFSCPGPLKYYEEVGCRPIFKNSGAECAERYDCDNLKELPTDKCFVNGHVYEIGDKLRDEDRNPCDVECICSRGSSGPKFNCAEINCPSGPSTPGCYLGRHPQNCCAGPEICPSDPEERPICVVDGKIYRDGEYFQPEAQPQKHCYCGPGYTAENSESYCVSSKIGECGTLLHNIDDIRKNCAPVYYLDQWPSTSCNSLSRCQTDKDVVVTSTSNPSSTADADVLCKLGNLTMSVGDTVNQGTDKNSACVICMCEVPPVPTCWRLPDEECEIVKDSAV